VASWLTARLLICVSICVALRADSHDPLINFRDGRLTTTTGGAVPPAAEQAHANPLREYIFRPENAWLAGPAHAQLCSQIENAVFLGERTPLTI
jgi:hypothetical protein